MRHIKIIVIFNITLLTLILMAITYGQVIIDNAERPKNKTAGRFIQLEEVMRIQDDGKRFVLRNPLQISELQDGSIIFFDFPFIIKVNQQGQFLFRIPNQGQGPGESQYPNFYLIKDNRIQVYSWIPPKILEYDLDGKLIKEFKTPPPWAV